MKSFNFCPFCGKNNQLSFPKSNHLVCGNCDFEWFVNPAPTSNIYLTNLKGEVLLGKRKNKPKANLWGSIGGFCDLNENFEEAVIREIEGEIGIKMDSSRIKYFFSNYDRYEFKTWNYHTINIIFEGRLNEEEALNLKANDDVSELKFFSFENIPWSEIAFESAKESLKNFVETKKNPESLLDLRSKIDEIDLEIIRSLSQRIDVVEKIGKLKRANKLPIYDQNRWNEVLEKLQKLSYENNLDFEIIKKIWEIIHLYSLRKERLEAS